MFIKIWLWQSKYVFIDLWFFKCCVLEIVSVSDKKKFLWRISTGMKFGIGELSYGNISLEDCKK